MTNPTPEPLARRGLFVTQETRTRLGEAAWREGVSSAALVRRGMAEFLEDPSKLDGYPEDPGNGNYHLHISVDGAAWEQVKVEAHKLRLHPTQVIRRIIENVSKETK